MGATEHTAGCGQHTGTAFDAIHLKAETQGELPQPKDATGAHEQGKLPGRPHALVTVH